MTVHGCGGEVLRGLDSAVAALTATVDPYPLSPLGEVEALRDGRRTYYLHWGALEPRDRYTIPGHPPSHALLVLAAHRCDQPIPETWIKPPAPAAPRQPVEEF